MKKIFSIALLLAAGVSMVSAQTSFYNTPRIGIRASYDHTFPTDLKIGGESIDAYNSGPGFSIGAMYNIPVAENIYFEPGLSIFYNTYKDSYITFDSPMQQRKREVTISKFGFRAPLTFGYRIPLFDNGGLNVFTGPQFDYGVKAKWRLDFDGLDTNLYSNANDMNRFDIAWRIGAGVYYGQWVAELSTAFGMLDMDSSSLSYHENRFSISVGYFF